MYTQIVSLPVDLVNLFHYLPCFVYPNWCKIPSITTLHRIACYPQAVWLRCGINSGPYQWPLQCVYTQHVFMHEHLVVGGVGKIFERVGTFAEKGGGCCNIAHDLNNFNTLKKTWTPRIWTERRGINLTMHWKGLDCYDSEKRLIDCLEDSTSHPKHINRKN